VYLIGLRIYTASLVIRAFFFGVFAYPRSYFGSPPSLTHLSDVTSYWLDGPGVEFRWGQGFLHPSRLGSGTPSLLCNGYRVPFPGFKWPGRGLD